MNRAEVQESFRENGYLELDDALGDHELQELRILFDDFILGQKKRYGLTAEMYDLVSGAEALKSVVVDLLGPNVAATLRRHNHASMGVGGDKSEKLHRDVLGPGFVTMIVYLDDALDDNGCTLVIPGSHTWERLPVPQGESGGGTWMDEHYEYADLPKRIVPVKKREGGALLMDGLLFHARGENASGRARRAITLGLIQYPEYLEVRADEAAMLYGERIDRRGV